MVRSVDRSRSCSRSTEVGKLWTNKANRLLRYTRLIVNCISHWTFRPILIPENPTYTSDDVTIILPTIATGGEELETTLRTCLRANVHELILETVDSNAESLSKVPNAVNAKKIRVLSIWEANHPTTC